MSSFACLKNGFAFAALVALIICIGLPSAFAGGVHIDRTTESEDDDEPGDEGGCSKGQCCVGGGGMGSGAGGAGGGGSGAGSGGGDFKLGKVGDPIWLYNGSMHIDATDLSVGVVFPIHLTRRYDGKSVFDTALGYGWAFDHDRRLFEYPDDSVILRSGCGRRDRFVPAGGGFATPNDGIQGTLSQLAGGRYEFVRSDAERNYFDSDGRLSAIQSREGHRHEFTYDTRGPLPLVGTSKRGVNPSQPMVVAYQPRLTRIEERSADGQLTGAAIDFFYDETTGRLTHIIASDGRRIDYAHDAVHGNLTGISGLGNYSQSFEYADPNNPHLLTTFTPATGVSPVVNVYDTKGRVTSQTIGDQVMTIAYPTETTRTVTWVVKDPAGATIHTRVHSYEFQGTDLVKETNALGHELQRFYTVNRDLEREELWQKPAVGSPTRLKTTNWTYDGQGRQLTESVTLDSNEVVTTTKTYDHGWVASTQTTSSLSSQLFRTEYTFHRDGNGVPVNIHEVKRRRDDGVFATTTYTYCSAADTTNAAAQCPYERLLKSVDGARTDVVDVTTYAYYTATDLSGCGGAGPCHRKGDLKRTTNALGHTMETLAYDAAGRPVKTQDANGVVSEVTYHVRGWPLTRTVLGANSSSTTDDATTTFTYDARGNVTTQIDPDNVTTTYVYDARNRLAEVQDASGGRLVYTYDSDGNRLTEEVRDGSNVLKRKRSFAYDKLGRLVIERDAQDRATTYEYDAAGNQTAVVDALNHRTQHTYDDLRRLTQTVADAATGGIQATTQFTYDAAGNLRSVIDPKGLTTSYTYNTLGQLTQLVSPDTGTTSYTYDLAGNRLTQTDARGITATYGYDAIGRLTATTYADTAFNVGYAYDQADSVTSCPDSFEIGRLTTMTDHSGNTKYCYDLHGQISRKRQNAAGQTLTVRYAYTLGGRLAGMTYPSGAQLLYGRDTQGRVETIDQVASPSNLPIVTATSYLPFGPLTQLSFAGGANQSFAYDQNYWIDGITGTALTVDYSTDALGNISGLPHAMAGQARVYEYDALSRLTTVKDGSATVLEAFSYDATGNRLSKLIVGSTHASYDYPPDSHRLASIDSAGGEPRLYDDMGSLIQKEDNWTFEYDPQARLSGISDKTTLRQANLYTGRGERVATSNLANWLGTVHTYVYNEAGQLLSERSRLNVQLPQNIREHVWLDDRPVAVLAHTDAYSDQILHVHSDHLGTPRAITRPAGANAVVWSWDLRGRAFGEDAANADPDADSVALDYNLRFPGQYFDIATGLNYNYFRDYEPGTGRYIESDPIGLRGGISTYPYVGSQPLGRIDPMGLSTTDFIQCLLDQVTAGIDLSCHIKIARKAEASASKWYSDACEEVRDGIHCTTVCAVDSFIGSDVSEVIFNAHKQAAISAINKAAKEVAVAAARKFVPVVGQLDMVYDASMTIVCTTDCVKK